MFIGIILRAGDKAHGHSKNQNPFFAASSAQRYRLSFGRGGYGGPGNRDLAATLASQGLGGLGFGA